MYRSAGGKGSWFCNSRNAVVEGAPVIFLCIQSSSPIFPKLKQPYWAAFYFGLPACCPGLAAYGSFLSGFGRQDKV
jgi:hypothetical protein